MADKNMEAQISVEFEEATSRQSLNSGETINTLWGKVKRWFTDLKAVCFSGSYNDLSDTPTTATTDTDGLMSAEDKGKLDAFEITTDGGKLHDKDIATTDLIPTSLPANGGNADTVNNHTVKSDVPENAVFTDTKVTSVDNHYEPIGKTTTSASGGTLTDISKSSNGVQVVTGVIKDEAGHVTGVTSAALKSTNTTYKAATSSTLGLIKSGTDITVDSNGNVSVNDNSHKHTVSNISDLTATAAELNVLDGITATTDELNHTHGVTDNIQTQLNTKAPLASPTFTGTPKAPTASAGTNTTQIATTAFVQTAVSNGLAASDAMIIKGTIGTGGTVTALPTTYKTGWTYRVITAGTYAGQVCEIGDLIIALVDRSGSGNVNSDWCVAQTNINGAITGIKSGDAYIGVSQSGSVVTITHKDVSRSNTTSTAKPSQGGTFTAVKSVTSDSKGHITSVDTETVTIPAHNTFSNVKIGSTTIAADTTADTIEIAGSNVTLTPDATNDKLTIGITKNNVTSALSYTPLSGLKVGASATATANAAATNGNVYLNVLNDASVQDSHNIVGSGATTVTSDANGKITINTDAWRVYNHIDDSYDVDNATSYGLYRVRGGTNTPTANWYDIHVVSLGGYITQMAISDVNTIYKRYKGSGGVWSAWTPINDGGAANSATQLATARTIDGMSFNGTANITHYGTCSTEAATAAKTVSLTGFTLATGAKITVKFTVANTAPNPTLNVNNTGAKAIYYRGAAIGKDYLAANRTYEFIYNGTQYELVGDLDTNSDTKVTNTLNTTAKAYVTGTTSATTNTGTQVFDTGVYLDTTAGQLVATTFKGDLSGTAENAIKIETFDASGNPYTGEDKEKNKVYVQWDGVKYLKLSNDYNKTAADYAASAGIVGVVNYPSSGTTRSVVLGFKPSCVIAVSQSFTNSSAGQKSFAVMITGSVAQTLYHPDGSVIISLTDTGFSANFNSGTVSMFRYIAFK